MPGGSSLIGMSGGLGAFGSGGGFGIALGLGFMASRMMRPIIRIISRRIIFRFVVLRW